MQIQLNLFLKCSGFISGDFDGKRIIKTKLQHFINLLAIYLMIFEFLKVILLTIDPNLDYILSVLYLTDDNFIQRIWTICSGLVHLAFAITYIYFYKFNLNGEKINFLNYLFCINEKELRLNYGLGYYASKRTSNMIKLNTKFSILWYIQHIVPTVYFIIIQSHTTRSIYLAFLNTKQKNGITIFEFLSFSIITSLTLDLVYLIESISISSFYIIFIANCKFITFRIEDLNGKLMFLIKLIQIGKYNSNSKNLNRKIRKIANQMNSILIFHKSSQYFANTSIALYYLCVLLIALFFPFMMLFGLTNYFFKIILIFTYFTTMVCTSFPIIYANTLVSEKFKEYRSNLLTFSRYSNNTKAKIKLLYFGAKFEDQLDFNCIDLFRYRNEFLLTWIIESISMCLMIYTAKNI